MLFEITIVYEFKQLQEGKCKEHKVEVCSHTLKVCCWILLYP